MMQLLLPPFTQAHLHNWINLIRSFNQGDNMTTRQLIGYVLRAATLLTVTIALVVLIIWLW